MLQTRHSLRRSLDTAKIEAALRALEEKTSGEIRISVAPFFWGNIRRTAERAFNRLGMRATRERNGVLFFVVPSRRQLVILGDERVHEKVGQAFWDSIAARVSRWFHSGEFTSGLLEGIEAVGAQLAFHFPPPPLNVNELPDEVHFD